MGRPAIALLVLLAAFPACAVATRTEVTTDFDPRQVPHRVVAETAAGSDGGFRLFGFIPFSSASQPGALADAFERLGIAPDDRHVVTAARFVSNDAFYLLFSIESVEVEASIIELTGSR
jgi:hypothetical protein